MTRGMPRDPSRWYGEPLEAPQKPIVASHGAPHGPPAAQKAAAEAELRAQAGDLFADEFLMIELTGTPDETHHLYVERGPIEGGVIYFGAADPTSVRDILPSRPVDRGGISFLTPESFGPGASLPRVRWQDRLRAWWRRHWWPARIRDLEAELRYANQDLWGDA